MDTNEILQTVLQALAVFAIWMLSQEYIDVTGMNNFDLHTHPTYTGSQRLLCPRKVVMVPESPATEIERVLQDIDRLIVEMTDLRRRVAALNQPPPVQHSVREAEYFGMWADRPDMQGRTFREWLEELRARLY